MHTLRNGLHWFWAKVQRAREWASGDDLHEAQMHRSDDHTIRPNAGPVFPSGGGT